MLKYGFSHATLQDTPACFFFNACTVDDFASSEVLNINTDPLFKSFSWINHSKQIEVYIRRAIEAKFGIIRMHMEIQSQHFACWPSCDHTHECTLSSRMGVLPFAHIQTHIIPYICACVLRAEPAPFLDMFL